MGEVNHIVDHLKLEYQGVFSIRDVMNGIGFWLKESPYEKGGDYVSEQQTTHGKCIEHTWWPWKKQTDYIRHFMKIRLLIFDAKKVDVMVEGKRKTLDFARIVLFIDGFVEYDYEGKWTERPMFQFIRSVFTKYFYRNYSKFFERMIVRDTHELYEHVQRIVNMHKTDKEIKVTPHFHF